MRRSDWSRPAWLPYLLLHISVGCGVEGSDAGVILPDLPPPRTEEWSEVREWNVREIAVHGAATGPTAFGIVVGVAVGARGLLAVADLLACSVTLIDRESGSFEGRVGRCGDGPGEFREIGALAFIEDTLLVYDRRSNALATLNLAGEEVTRVRLDLPPRAALTWMRVVDGRRVVASMERVASGTDVPKALDLVGVFEMATGELVETMIAEVRLAREGPQNFLRRKAVCVHGHDGGSLLAVLNEWAFQVAAVELRGRAVAFNARVGLDLAPGRTGGGNWVPGGLLPGVACTPRGAVFKLSTVERFDDSDSIRQTTHIEARKWNGTVMMRRTIVGGTSLIHARIGDTKGDTIFMFANGLREYPVVGEIVIEEGDGDYHESSPQPPSRH